MEKNDLRAKYWKYKSWKLQEWSEEEEFINWARQFR